MAKIILSILLVCLIATVMMVSADPAPFKQCMSNGVFFPQSLDITPAKPKAGDTLVAVATVSKLIIIIFNDQKIID